MVEYYLVRVKPLSNEDVDSIEVKDISYIEENYEGTCYKIFHNLHTESRIYMLLQYMRRVELSNEKGKEIAYVVYIEPIYKFSQSVGYQVADFVNLTDSEGDVIDGYASFPFHYYKRLYMDIRKTVGFDISKLKKNELILFEAAIS